MVYLNYNNLDAQTQAQLLSDSKKDVEANIGAELKAYADHNGLSYDDILEEEAIRNLYSYQFTFNL